MVQQTNIRLNFNGQSIYDLTELSILKGDAKLIQNIDYNNIVHNKLIFTGPELSIENTGLNPNGFSCNIVRFNSNLYHDKDYIYSNIQLKLIPNLGIRISDNSNISVNFSDGGWSSNNNILYTNINKIGIGISEPLSTLHIKDINASLIIENNNNNFKFSYNNNIFTFGNNNKYQFNIHKDATENSIYINESSTVNIGCNLNVMGDTILTSNIYINNNEKKDIITWLTDDKNIATKKFVQDNGQLTDNTILRGIGSNITNLDYKKITTNSLIFNNPLIYNSENNTIDINLSETGWTKKNNIIYSLLNSNIGIGTSSPLGTLHIGSTNETIDGTFVISKTVISNKTNTNFKFGYDDSFNFVFGNLNTNTNIWSKQFYINQNAPNESLIINAEGDININADLIIKNSLSFNKNSQTSYNINIDNNNNFNIDNNKIIINKNGSIGIGTIPSNNIFKLYIDGKVNILSDLHVLDIYGNNGFLNILNATNLNISENLNVLLNITANTINTNLLSTTNINTNNINITDTIYVTNILSSGSIDAAYIDVDNMICSNNLICIENINGNIINATNIISDNIETLYNITSCNINITNNLTSSSNIYADLLIYSSNDIISKNNIYSKNIVSEKLNATTSIQTKTLNSININNNERIYTKNLETININATNINATDINTNNITIKTKLIIKIAT